MSSGESDLREAIRVVKEQLEIELDTRAREWLGISGEEFKMRLTRGDYEGTRDERVMMLSWLVYCV
jgi:hypothetical protein